MLKAAHISYFCCYATPLLVGGMKPEQTSKTYFHYPEGRLVYHASSSGHPTMDADTQGGNPFA